MLLPHNAHVAVVDGGHFLLFRNSGNEQSPALTSVELPTGAEPSRNAHEGDSPRQDVEASHAAAVAEALNAAVLGHKIDHLVIIADPRTLGDMRKVYHKQLEQKLLGEITKTLTSHPVEDILQAIHHA